MQGQFPPRGLRITRNLRLRREAVAIVHIGRRTERHTRPWPPILRRRAIDGRGRPVLWRASLVGEVSEFVGGTVSAVRHVFCFGFAMPQEHAVPYSRMLFPELRQYRKHAPGTQDRAGW